MFLGIILILQFSTVISSSAFAEETISWECRIKSNNKGCQKTIRAPRGKLIVAVKAACNLEYGAVSERELKAVSINKIKVIRASDKRWYETRGSCYVGNTKVFTGQKKIKGVDGVDWIRVGCKEYDKNGGDCHIKGIIFLKKGKKTPPKNRDVVKIKRVCGIGNCPRGFHDKAYARSLSCGSTFYLNQTVCQNNVGAFFYKCGVRNCPNGYKNSSTSFNSSCALGNTLSVNQTRCVRK